MALHSIALLGTLGCHLCEQAHAIVHHVVGEEFRIYQIDIASREEWVAQYGLLIPVVECGGQELHWPFNDADVAAWLSAIEEPQRVSQLAPLMITESPKSRRYLR